MPYKDPLRKKEWEQLHGAQRLERRRELRHLQAMEQGAAAFVRRFMDATSYSS